MTATKVVYRPTCHYAYHPCDDAVLSLHEMSGAAWQRQPEWKILDENEIVDGVDELGVLLYGHAKNAYWYGSQLSIEETRRLAPYQNATGLQVTSAVLAGIVWMLENPDRGVIEADEMDFRRCLDIQRPYLGNLFGAYTDWTPLTGRAGGLFPDDVDDQRSLAVQERAGRLTTAQDARLDGGRDSARHFLWRAQRADRGDPRSDPPRSSRFGPPGGASGDLSLCGSWLIIPRNHHSSPP